MVSLTDVLSANESLTHNHPLVAVFVGATSGIGEYSLEALATSHGSSSDKALRVYLVGRNEAAASKSTFLLQVVLENCLTLSSVFAECKSLCPNGEFRFVKANDLALIMEVDRACEEIARLENGEKEAVDGKARVDLLVMTQAYLAFEERKGTYFKNFSPVLLMGTMNVC